MLTGKGRLVGTVATPLLSELRLITRPAGAGLDRVKLRFCVWPTARLLRVAGEKPSVELTVMVSVALTRPLAVAVITAEPKLTPVIWGKVAGVVVPAGINTDGLTVTLLVSPLIREMVTPPAPAGADKLMGSPTD